MQIKGWFGKNDEETLLPYVKALKPKSLLVEIGTYYGKSTLFFRQANPNIRILTIDICSPSGVYDGYEVEIPEHIDERVLNKGNIFQVIGDSQEIVKWFNWDIDFLFVDSLHTFGNTYRTLLEWGKHVVPNGVIACHDYGTFPGVTRAVDKYARRTFTGGIAIFEK